MEEELKEKLEEIYLFNLEVEWLSFRQYKILGFLAGKTIKIIYTYDANLTLNFNINIICQKLDKEILKIFKRSI